MYAFFYNFLTEPKQNVEIEEHICARNLLNHLIKNECNLPVFIIYNRQY